jgi:4-oxalomesaconate tautomerase
VVSTPGGRVAYQGAFALDGVPGTGAPIILHFLASAGGQTGRLLPTGNALDRLDGVCVCCVDFANPIAMIAAAAVGKSGHESKQELDTDTAWLAELESLRRRAARLMAMAMMPGRDCPRS